MPNLRRLAVAMTLVTRSALGAEAPLPLLPPAELPAEPPALSRASVEERRPVELLGFGRVLLPLAPTPSGSGFAAGGAVSLRGDPYLSWGVEASAARVAGPAEQVARSWELAAVGRVYLFESGAFDPYLELGLGYAVDRAEGARAGSHGPSARAGGGLDWVIVSPLRLGAHAAYRERVEWPSRPCAAGCRARLEGGLLAGLALTLAWGDPL